MTRVEVFARQADITGECPLWSVGEQALFWLDIGARTLYRKHLFGVDVQSWILPDYPGCLAELEAGAIAVALGDGVQRLNLKNGNIELMYSVASKRPATRFNDGKVDPRGRFWVSTMQNNFGPSGERIVIDRSDGALFRFDADGHGSLIEEDIGCANTLAWSPDLKRFYFADSLKNQIYVYDFDAESGDVRNRRLFFHEKGFGLPDGSTIDIDGCLWNARWDAGVLVRITPGGKLDMKIELPVLRPTSCIFGGDNLDTLFVTSSRNGLSEAQLDRYPLSGSVFAVTGVGRGLPVPPMIWNHRLEPGQLPILEGGR